VISFKQSFNAFSSMIVALLICWIARDMFPPNCANTIFAFFFEFQGFNLIFDREREGLTFRR